MDAASSASMLLNDCKHLLDAQKYFKNLYFRQTLNLEIGRARSFETTNLVTDDHDV